MNTGTVADSSSPRTSGARGGVRSADWTTVAVIGVTLVAAALRFWRIGQQSFWFDEAYTVVEVHRSPIAMLKLLPHAEVTPPLYYCFAWVWVRIFGYGQAGLRSLSAVFGIVTVPVMYAAGKELISRRAGVVAAALVAFNPFLIWYSQEARSYALLALMAALSLLAFAHARLPRPRTRWIVAWFVFASLTLTTHYYGLLAAVPEGIWLLWVHRRDRRVWLAVAGVGAVGAALLPLAFSEKHSAYWIPKWPVSDRLSQIPAQFLLGTGAPARTVLKLAGAAAVALAALMLWRRADASERRGATVAAVLGVAGFALSLILIVPGVDEVITRNVIVLLIPLILVIAAGLGARRAGLLGMIGVGTLCAVGAVAAIAVSVDRQFQRPDWRAVARTLGSWSRTGPGRAILLQHHEGILPLELYMPRLRFIKKPGARVDQLDLVSANVGLPHAWFCWWGAACNLPASALDTSIRLRGFHQQGPVLHVDQFEILRLRAARPVRITPREVSRVLLRSPKTPRLRLDAFLLQR